MVCAAATRQQTAPHGAISHPPDAADCRDSLPRPRSARGRERRTYATAQAVRGGYSPAEAGLFPTAHVAHHVGPPIRNLGTRPVPFGLRLRHARPFVCASEDAMQVDCRPLIEGGAAERRNRMHWYYPVTEATGRPSGFSSRQRLHSSQGIQKLTKLETTAYITERPRKRKQHPLAPALGSADVALGGPPLTCSTDDPLFSVVLLWYGPGGFPFPFLLCVLCFGVLYFVFVGFPDVLFWFVLFSC